MEKGWTLQEKQQYLRSQIIDSGVDPESFMVFMGNQKGQGLEINLENWNVGELKSIVNDFKISLMNELKRENESRIKMKIESDEQLAKKKREGRKEERNVWVKQMREQKVFYDRDDLWDVEMDRNQDCKKGLLFFDEKLKVQIICKQVEVKKIGGFIFGIGGKNCIFFSLYSNVSSQPIVRQSQDVDWLRKVLISLYPGVFVPGLGMTPVFEAGDSMVVHERVKEIMVFLGILVKHHNLINNKYVHMFLTESNSKSFQNFKNKNLNILEIKDVYRIENPQGRIKSEISRRILDFIKNSSKFSREMDDIYKNLKQCFTKYQKDLQAVAKSSHSLSVIFRLYEQKYGFFVEKSGMGKNMKRQKQGDLGILLRQLKESFLNVSAQNKRESQMFRDLVEDEVEKNGREWSQFNVFIEGYRKELDSYLSEKLVLNRKKQEFMLHVNRGELGERQGMGKIGEMGEERQKVYLKNNMRLNEEQERKKVTIGYKNVMFQKSFLSVMGSQEFSFENKMVPIFSTLSNLLNQRVILYKQYLGKIKEKKQQKK